MTHSMIVNAKNISDSSKIIVPNIGKEKYLYHYTSPEGIKGVLEGKKLWFTGIQYMNDANEIVEGINSMKKYLLEYEIGLDEKDKAEYKNSVTELFKAGYDAYLNSNIFVCCFSIGRDELPLWNYYTKDNMCQGYNICLNIKKLMVSIVKNNKHVLDGCAISYGKVQYSNSEDRIRMARMQKYYKGMLDLIMEQFSEPIRQIMINLFDVLAEKEEISGDQYDDMKCRYGNEIDAMLVQSSKNKKALAPIYKFNGEKLSFDIKGLEDPNFYIKNSSFESEKEVRIVITIPEEKILELKKEGAYKFRICHGMLVPYLELKFDEDVVQGITISPTIKDEIAARGIEKFALSCGYDLKKMNSGIQRSQVPLRY